MAASRKKKPELLDVIQAHWPDTLSGQCALELGLSGGLDSVVLLHLLWRLRQTFPFSLFAVHVHHGLSPNADAWATFCQALCAKLAVPLRIVHVTVSRSGGQSLEAQARAERYAVFAKTTADAIVLAQHQDDLVETVLLQALRGGGPHALAAMPHWSAAGVAPVWRPLLEVGRSMLQDYACEQGLQWVEDESNSDPSFRRNWLRHVWLPQLAESQPNYRMGLARCASNMADAASILDEVAAEDLARAVEGGRLQLDVLATLSLARQRQVLLRWVEGRELGIPTPDSLEVFQQQIWQAGVDRIPEWSFPGGVVFRYRGQLWIERGEYSPFPCCFQFMPGQELSVPEWGGRLVWRSAVNGIGAQWLQGMLVLQPRHGGERIRQAIGMKAVKTLLQEAALPPRLRSRWPLLYGESGELLAVAGVAVSLDVRDVQNGGWWPEWIPD